MNVICAIIGASAPEAGMIKIGDIKTLYLMAEGRGGHACGFTDGKVIIKSAMNSYEYVREIVKQPKFPKKFSSFIGHTRFATIGNKDVDENAHPFAKKGLIGVHNGSIYNYEDIKKITESDAIVDSEVLYDSISKFGLKKTLPLLNGLLALSYYNLKNKSINLYRFEKPLWYGRKDGVLFWASLKEYLEAIDCTHLKELQPHTIYKVAHGKIAASKNMADMFLPTAPTKIHSQHGFTYSKTPSLDIFLDRINHLKTFKMKNIDEILKEKEEERISKKVTGFGSLRSVSSNKGNNKKEYNIYNSDNKLGDVPMHAKFFNTDKDGRVFLWFSSELPGVVYIFNYTLGITDGFDLDDERDIKLLSNRYGLDSSDILQDIMHEYAIYKDTYDARQELENDENEKNKSKFCDSVCD